MDTVLSGNQKQSHSTTSSTQKSNNPIVDKEVTLLDVNSCQSNWYHQIKRAVILLKEPG